MDETADFMRRVAFARDFFSRLANSRLPSEVIVHRPLLWHVITQSYSGMLLLFVGSAAPYLITIVGSQRRHHLKEKQPIVYSILSCNRPEYVPVYCADRNAVP